MMCLFFRQDSPSEAQWKFQGEVGRGEVGGKSKHLKGWSGVETKNSSSPGGRGRGYGYFLEHTIHTCCRITLSWFGTSGPGDLNW